MRCSRGCLGRSRWKRVLRARSAVTGSSGDTSWSGRHQVSRQAADRLHELTRDELPLSPTLSLRSKRERVSEADGDGLGDRGEKSVGWLDGLRASYADRDERRARGGREPCRAPGAVMEVSVARAGALREDAEQPAAVENL